MLMIKTKIKQSPIHGMGLFADQFIPKGTVTWRFAPNFDIIVPKDDILRLSQEARALFLNYCYVDKYTKHFILCFDDERFINHSENPNIGQSHVESEIEGVEIALRDIQKGEELLVDYYEFDHDAERKLKRLDMYVYMQY